MEKLYLKRALIDLHIILILRYLHAFLLFRFMRTYVIVWEKKKLSA